MRSAGTPVLVLCQIALACLGDLAAGSATWQHFLQHRPQAAAVPTRRILQTGTIMESTGTSMGEAGATCVFP